MTSKFLPLNAQNTAPAEEAIAVTPSDNIPLVNGACRALYIGVTGDVNIITPNATTVLFKAVPVGILPVRAATVMSTSTTATNIVALY